MEVKSCDYPGEVAGRVFELLNPTVKFRKDECGEMVIFTDTPPCKLNYPEGWYYAKGMFRNKHNSTTGGYSEIIMVKETGQPW